MKALKDILLRVLTTRVAWPILITLALLCSASLLALELSSPERVVKQRLWILIGSGVILVALLPHYNLLGRVAYGLYALSVFLLIAVFFVPAVKGTNRWFVLPGGTQLQPSELAKIAFVLALAWNLRFRKNLATLQGLIIPFALTFVPFILILKEPDLGTALLFPLVLYAMLLAAGASARHLVIIALIALAAGPGAYPLLRPYQQDRIKSAALMAFGMADAAHLTGDGLQQYRSEVAIGSGGSTGQERQGDPSLRADIVPEAHTDFIFSVIGAKWGFAGCLAILLIYLAFFGVVIEIASSTRDHFGRLLAVGLAAMILFQATINMCMTIGLAPVVGIALPFVSYGGSSLLASMLATGILLNVSVRRNTKSGTLSYAG